MEERRVEEVQGPGRPPRNPWLWLSLLALAVVVGAILLVAAIATRGNDEPEPAPPPAQPAGPVSVPNLVGSGHATAGRAAENGNLVADTFPVDSDAPAGQVIAQDPEPGTEVEVGSVVRLDVAIGPDPLAAIVVPDTIGLAEPQAREALRRAPLTMIATDAPAPSPGEAGRVVEQDPAAGTTVPALTQVTLTVGR